MLLKMLQLAGPAPRRRAAKRSAILLSSCALIAPAHALTVAIETSNCVDQGGLGRVLSRSQWKQRGSTIERRVLPPVLRDSSRWVQVEERGVDVEIEILDRAGAVVARSDSPVERSALQYVYVPAKAGGVSLVVRAKEPEGLEGTVRVAFLAAEGLTSPDKSTDCAGAMRQWADADMAYARGRLLTLGRIAAETESARSAFEAAGRAYIAAREALKGPTHIEERGLLELNLAALSYYGLKDWKGSASWSAQAGTTFTDSHDPYGHSRARAIEAAAWIELATAADDSDQTVNTPQATRAQFARARALLTELAHTHAMRREWYDQALQINNIGLAYTYESRFEDAIPYFLRAQRAFEGFGDTTRSALALQNIGYCDWGLGRLSAAITRFDRAAEMMASLDRPNLYLIALNNDGLAHYESGRLDESLRLENMALDLATRLQSDQARARSDFGIGVTYYAIGDKELAVDFLRRGLEIATPERDARLRVEVLRALAQIELETGHHAEAIQHDSEALRLASASWARARILLHLAQEYAAQGNANSSGRILDELIAHPPNRDELVRAMARIQRAQYLRATGSFRLARGELIRAIEVLDRFDSLGDRFAARVELAKTYADQGLDEQAVATLHRALEYSREIRAQTANPEYRTSIIQSLRPALSMEIDLLHERFNALVKQGRLGAARAVARESLAAVDADRAAGFEAWRDEQLEGRSDKGLARLLSSSATLYRDMAERRYELAIREDRAGSDDARARLLRVDIARMRVRLGLVNAEIAKHSGSEGADGSASRQESETSGRALGAGRGVLAYWLGTTRAYAWVLKGRHIDWIEVASSASIDRTVRTLHRMMRSPVSVAERREVCTQLYRLVLASVRPLLSDVSDLTIIPDASLHYVPFAALRDPAGGDKPYLVQAVALSIAPALRFVPGDTSAPKSNRDPVVGTRMLVVADPIYTADDPRLGHAGKAPIPSISAMGGSAPASGVGGKLSLVRLESSAREAAQIRALYGSERVDLLQGADATREAVLAKDLASYRFIHIATHGVVDADIPQLSALILGTHDQRGLVRDPYLRAGDFLTRTFHAQTVVFSACDTALGKEYSSEGLVGLRYAALARGAHAVVASLWPVSDGISASLMTDMYRDIVAFDRPNTQKLASGGLSVARALASAMRAQLERAPALDPALWAPFTVYVAGE